MTDISVVSTAFQVENRNWYLGTADEPGFTKSVNLDVSGFTAATHYPNGFLKSGIVLGMITATGKYVPYVDAAVDGSGVAACILFSSVKVPDLADLTHDVNGAGLCAFAAVSLAKLLLVVANAATGGGFIDANGQTDLRNIYFAA